MAGHSHLRLPADEPPDFVPRTAKAAGLAKVAGAAGIVLLLALGIFAGDGMRTFYHAYLTGFAFFLGIGLCGLFFVLIHHVTRAGWSVNVRRVAENIAGLLPVISLLSLPIFIAVLMQRGDLYRWALPDSAAPAGAHEKAEHHDQPSAGRGEETGEHSIGAPANDPDRNAAYMEAQHHETDPGAGKRKLDSIIMEKRAWLNPGAFCLRLVIYFGLWSVIARYYLKKSVLQDADGDHRHTVDMQRYSAPSLVIFGLTVTLAAWDMFMSLDPHWYSTMFGVYYFASSLVLFFAVMIVVLNWLQKAGFLREAVTTEHYHDLGKYLFAFTFFWGYITFSQYMLIWYASIPEEVGWPARHGMSTWVNTPGHGGDWWPWALAMLFGCVLIPFGGLLSRHVKRNRKALLFWAWWTVVFQFANMIWIVIPELKHGLKAFDLLAAVAAWVGLGGILSFLWIRIASRHRLRPVNDPRVFESAAFVNI